MGVKIYTYSKCTTCVKAVSFLGEQKLKFQEVPIVEKPPSVRELKTMLKFLTERGGSFKNLFNTSGERYRELKISEKIKAGLTEAEAFALLSENGMLVKRPFLLVGEGNSFTSGTVGFKPEEWKLLLKEHG